MWSAGKNGYSNVGSFPQYDPPIYFVQLDSSKQIIAFEASRPWRMFTGEETAADMRGPRFDVGVHSYAPHCLFLCIVIAIAMRVGLVTENADYAPGAKMTVE